MTEFFVVLCISYTFFGLFISMFIAHYFNTVFDSAQLPYITEWQFICIMIFWPIFLTVVVLMKLPKIPRLLDLNEEDDVI